MRYFNLLRAVESVKLRKDEAPMTTYDLTASPPVPVPDELTRFYWDAVSDRRIELLRCQACGHYVHYPRPICNRCLSTDLAP